MKVWISKYALSQGIKESEAEISSTSSDMIVVKADKALNEYYSGKGKEWHTSKEDAVNKAEEMRLKKIESLQKQIKKLEKLDFRK